MATKRLWKAVLSPHHFAKQVYIDTRNTFIHYKKSPILRIDGKHDVVSAPYPTTLHPDFLKPTFKKALNWEYNGIIN